jgi:hypothetical protein
VIGATWPAGSLQVAVNVEPPACVAVADNPTGGGGALFSTVICSEATAD